MGTASRKRQSERHCRNGQGNCIAYFLVLVIKDFSLIQKTKHSNPNPYKDQDFTVYMDMSNLKGMLISLFDMFLHKIFVYFQMVIVLDKVQEKESVLKM